MSVRPGPADAGPPAAAARVARGAAAGVLAGALLAGCAIGPPVDTSHRAVSQGPRVDLVVIHYTALNSADSLRVLTQQEVSSHYLVDVDPPTIYRLVDEDQRANHAGISFWHRRHLVNTSSIGIEIVNLGYEDTPEGRRYFPFPERQIDAVIALVKSIVRRWKIPPERVVGHGDIAPGRKVDPGPMFPWKRLAAEGLAIWPDEGKVAALTPHFERALPDVAWFQQRLARIGYFVPLHGQLDKATRDVMVAFQMRFRPARYDGEPDAECAAMLAVLTEMSAPAR